MTHNSTVRGRFSKRRVAAAVTAVLLSAASQVGAEMLLLPNDRVIVGTVAEVRGGEIKVNTADIEPLYLPIKQAQEKGIGPLHKGDRLQIVLNEQNMVLGYHRAGEPGWHHIVQGQLAQALLVGQEWAVVKPDAEPERIYRVRPLIRSKMAGIPVGGAAVFLIDETGQIMDAVFGSEETLRSATTSWAGSMPKASHRQLNGILARAVEGNSVRIQTADGQEQTLQARDYVITKLEKLHVGQPLTLLLDSENKVADVAAQ